MKFQDYYEVLGVSRSASTADIKKAYHKLAMEWHPDRHQGAGQPKAEAKFKQINEAKEVLLDPEKRKKYDQFGEHWQHGQDFTPPTGGSSRRVSPEQFAQMFGGGDGGFSDFFANMFGDDTFARFQSRGTKRRRAPQGADVNAQLHLSLSAAIAGGKRTFSISTQSPCMTCGGLGALDDDHVCPSCAGLGRVRGQKTVELAIPRNLSDGMKLRLRGLGELDEDGGQAGDLYLTLTLDSDETYRCLGADIEADLPLAPWEALDGVQVRLKTLDGTATLNVPPNTQSRAKLRMRGQGLFKESGRGDFYAVVRIALPDPLSDPQRDLIRQLKKTSASGVSGGARLP